MTAASGAFLGEIRQIVTSAIEASGGEVRLSEAAATTVEGINKSFTGKAQ
jgi:hypothetical protein